MRPILEPSQYSRLHRHLMLEKAIAQLAALQNISVSELVKNLDNLVRQKILHQ